MSGRPSLRGVVAAVALAGLAACQKAPVVGSKVGAVQGPTGPKVELTSLGVNATGQVVVAYTLTKDGSPVTGAAATAFDPAFTLAALGTDPVTPTLPAWRSLLLTGAEKLVALPVAGPGTPDTTETILRNTPQPGPDAGGVIKDNQDGTFTYTFSAAVGAFQAAETLRAGVFLRGVSGSVLTTSTCDGVGAPGTTSRCADAVSARQLVVDEACASCHGTLRAHAGSRHGTRICVTCHTYQHADAETVDPAALALAITSTKPAQATPATTATNPNPLELARLVHRIHRGRSLPTLYKANQAPATSTTKDGVTITTIAGEAPPLGRIALPLPFALSRLTNPSQLLQEFSVVGEEGRERVFSQVLYRTDNGHTSTDGVATAPPQAAKVVRGITFPRDYRDCDACHPRVATAGVPAAKDAALIDAELSRRGCQGCHPDVWFGDGVPDAVHVAHPGGPQANDSSCATCHGASAALAPTTEVHTALVKSAHYNRPVVEIISVTDFKPGLTPTIKFRVSDETGALDSLAAPTVATDANSPIPRAITSMTLGYARLAAAGVDFLSLGTSAATRESFATVANTTNGTRAISEIPAAAGDGTITYTFATKVPDGAAGTWMVSIEARRALGSTASPAPFYDYAGGTEGKGRFYWPYTGENLSELADNAFRWVDVADGVSDGPNAQPRRMLMDVAKCNKCHLRLTYHGSRTSPDYCVTCHTSDRTDWSRRPMYSVGDAPSPALVASVNLGATFDNIEERALQLKVLIHRIHTGGRSGPASLQLTRPYTGSGGKANARFRDMGEFPNDLANCTLCHDASCYRVESVPADAPPTLANETSTITHLGTSAHGADEIPVPPVTAACMGCHATAYAQAHTAKYITAGKEQCVSCHGAKGSYSVERTHGLPTDSN